MMEWEVFTLEDERLRILGQEISNDIGRSILALLKEKPMSPNDLSKELEVPLTTIMFHVEKLRDAGLIRPLLKMAGRRGQKTLYTLTSSAFIILPTFNVDKERFLETLRTAIAVPRELILRGAIVGLLIGVLMLSPWYLLTVSYYSREASGEGRISTESAPVNASIKAATMNTTTQTVKVPRIPNETQVSMEKASSEEVPWTLAFLLIGVLSSMTSAVAALLISRRSRNFMGYREERASMTPPEDEPPGS